MFYLYVSTHCINELAEDTILNAAMLDSITCSGYKQDIITEWWFIGHNGLASIKNFLVD